jgi:hypothetical protein
MLERITTVHFVVKLPNAYMKILEVKILPISNKSKETVKSSPQGHRRSTLQKHLVYYLSPPGESGVKPV